MPSEAITPASFFCSWEVSQSSPYLRRGNPLHYLKGDAVKDLVGIFLNRHDLQVQCPLAFLEHLIGLLDQPLEKA